MSKENESCHYDEIVDLMSESCPKTADKFKERVTPDSDNLLNRTNTFLRRELCAHDEDTREMRLDLQDDAPFTRWRNGIREVLNQGVLA